MERSYYERYYTLERNHWWFVVRSKIINASIKKFIPEAKERKILNVGIATGATSIMLEKFGQVVSSEFDQETCDFVKNEVGLDVIQASITELPFENNSFDLVCAFDVIEHVEDDQKGMEELMRVVKPGGLIVLTVPADMSLWSEHDVINHHFRRYEKKEVLQLQTKSGVQPIYATYFNSLLFPAIKCMRWIKSKKSPENTPQSDFDIQTPDWLNRILGIIFSFELILLKFIKFPAGVSILTIGKK